jgi:dynactin 1
MANFADLAVGQTVRLSDGRIGTIRFLGRTNFSPGDWVGVELEEQSGKNDGSVNGERYFDCGLGRGMFLRPPAITVVAQAPPPVPKPAAGAGAAARKGGRPSSLFTSGASRANAASDPALGKRMSLNAPSPSPVPRMSRPSSIARVCTVFCPVAMVLR